jgi:glycosyltransferase involved in cell wall biosynthesis
MPSTATSSEVVPRPSRSTARRRRHAMVVHAYYPLGETRVQREAEALTTAGWEVDVVCLRATGEPRRERDGRVTVHRLPVRRHRDRGMAVQLLEYAAFTALAFVAVSWLQLRRRFTTVQVHNPPDLLVLSALVPKLLGVPVVLDIHDLTPELFASRMGPGGASVVRRLVELQERVSCRLADHVITVTSGWRERLTARGVAPGKVSVTMNVADPRHFTPASRPPSEDDGDGRFRVVYHGTLTERYGVDVLLEAAAALAPELPGLHLSILGDGDARPALLRRAEELRLEQHVSFSPGMLDVPDVVREIRDADVGIVPNRRNGFTDEILPTKLLEYVAVGVPVIASRTAGLEAYLDDGMVEYVIPGDVDDLAASLRRLHADPHHRRELVRRADGFHARHGWAAISADYVARIDQLAHVRGGHT